MERDLADGEDFVVNAGPATSNGRKEVLTQSRAQSDRVPLNVPSNVSSNLDMSAACSESWPLQCSPMRFRNPAFRSSCAA